MNSLAHQYCIIRIISVPHSRPRFVSVYFFQPICSSVKVLGHLGGLVDHNHMSLKT